MILSPKQCELINNLLKVFVPGTRLLEEHEGIVSDLKPLCPAGMSLHAFLKQVARTGRTDSLDPPQVAYDPSQIGAFAPQKYPSTMIPITAADKEQFDGIIARNIDKYGTIPADASGMREVQARIRQIIKAEPSSGIYMIMMKCYDDPVCKRWYKTSPWLLRIQISNAIRNIIDAEEADVLSFLSGAPVAPSDF